MSWLTDRFDEFKAQVNVNDGNKTAATVRKNRTNQSGVTKKKTGFKITDNSLTRGVSRTVDQVNFLDNGRTWQNRKPTNTRSIGSQLTHNGITNTVGNLGVKPIANTASMSIIEPARSLVAQGTGNNEAFLAAEQRKRLAREGSIPGMLINQAKNTYDVATAVPQTLGGIKRGFDGKAPTEEQEAARIKGLSALNKTFVGQLYSIPQQKLAERDAGIRADLQAAGVSTDKSLGQQFADTSMGVLSTLGGAATLKGTGAVVSNVKNGNLQTAVANTKNTITNAIPNPVAPVLAAGKSINKLGRPSGANLQSLVKEEQSAARTINNLKTSIQNAYNQGNDRFVQEMTPVLKSYEKQLDIIRARKSGQGGYVRIPGGNIKPVKLYHGSNAKFDKFDPAKIGTGEGTNPYGGSNNLFGEGAYLTDNKAAADVYAMATAKRKYATGYKEDGILSDYTYPNNVDELAAKDKVINEFESNGKVFDASTEKVTPDIIKVIADNTKTGIPAKDIAYEITRLLSFIRSGEYANSRGELTDILERFNQPEVTAAIKKYLQDNGYDGVKYPAGKFEGTAANNYVIFNPEKLSKPNSPLQKLKQNKGGYINPKAIKDDLMGKGAPDINKQIEAENVYLEKNAGKTLENGMTIPEGYKAYRRTVTGDTVDVKRLKNDKEYFKKAYESVFARGQSTDEKLYKTLTKELVPKDKEPSSYLADLYNQAKSGAPIEKTPNPTVAAIEQLRTPKGKTGQKKVVQPVKNTPEVPPQPAPSRIENTPQELPSQPKVSDTPRNLQEIVESSSSSPAISLDNTPDSPSSKEWATMLRQADEELPSFNAVAGSKGTNAARKLVDAIKTDNKITQAAKDAQTTGKQVDFFAKKDRNGRSVGIERFDPSQHRIEAGFVVDSKGNALGNHIKVDETGIQVNVGGDLVNMEAVLGNPLEWKGKYKVSETLSRNIDSNAPTKEIAQQTKDFVVGSKVKAEANFKKELKAEYDALESRIKTLKKARKGTDKKQFDDDVFSVLDGTKTDAEIISSYPKQTADAILGYKNETRTLYDSLLTRINAERVKFGQAPITPRKDYITHLQEMNSDRSFVGDIRAQISNSFTDEGMARTRGTVPGQIAGRTENFEPRSAWNKYLQRRTGDKSLRDPYKAVQEYLEPALYNIHMTEPTVRARAVEAAFRTAGELRDMQPDTVLKQTQTMLQRYKQSGENSNLVKGFQEYANALAKKTQRLDRVITDSSDASARALKEWQRLQRIGGRATIVGNISSVLAQPLNQAIGLADAGPTHWLRGITKTVGGDKAIKQSPFIQARMTKVKAPLRGKGEKVLDAGGAPLQAAEQASIKIIWNSQHSKALSQGKRGMEAIKAADYNTERLVAGRGIADRPELYRSTAANGFLQYTLEVNAQYKAIMKDLTPEQKATFLVTAMAMNTVWGTVTGTEPLPDFLGAAIDTGSDFLDSEDERSGVQKAIGGVQRGAGEFVQMNPAVAATANTFLSQNQRETLFGEDSTVGQFEGTAAPVQVVRNAFNAANNFRKGNYQAARDDALKTVPAGNQAQKTIRGAEMIQRGYAIDDSGNPTFEAPKSMWGQAQALALGPGSTKEAKAYYGNDKEAAKETKTAAKNLSKGKSGETVSRSDQLKEGKQYWLNQYGYKTQTEVQEAADSGDENAIEALNKLKGVDKTYAKPLDLPKGTPENVSKVLKTNARLSEEGKAKWGTKVNTDPQIRESIKRWLGKDAPEISNNTAVMWAEYQRDYIAGKIPKTEAADKKKAILKNMYSESLSEDEKNLLSSKVSTAELKQFVEDSTVSEDMLKRALEAEKAMYDAGLQDKEYLRRKLDLPARGYKTSSSRSGSSKSGGTRKAKYDFKPFGLVDVESVNKSLAQLLKEAYS